MALCGVPAPRARATANGAGAPTADNERFTSFVTSAAAEHVADSSDAYGYGAEDFVVAVDAPRRRGGGAAAPPRDRRM